VVRKLFRRTLKYFVCPILLASSLLAIGYFTPRKWSHPTSQDCQTSIHKIYVSGDQMHVNLVLPVQNQVFDWNQFIPTQTIGRSSQTYRYLKFGWGDRDFYMNTPNWSEVRITSVLRALLMPGNPTALYVQGYPEFPQEDGVTIKCIGVTQPDYLRLVNFIQNSFQRDPRGQPIRIQDGYDATSGFYKATGHYSILRTCNTWAADGLRAAHLNTPLWSGLAPAVMRHVRGCTCEESSK
jgi:uncharacterized protein (TIGR02117 family)